MGNAEREHESRAGRARTVNGAEFAATYGPKGFYAWEAAALELAKQGKLTPWPWVPLTLRGAGGDGQPHEVVLQVRSDVLSIGPFDDALRLPLTPRAAQSIANLDGTLLPTPWLDYQIWRAAPAKLQPVSARQNKGANMAQYLEHSRAIDAQLVGNGVAPGTLTAGQKKDIVVSNVYKPKTVLIHGWYSPDLPDVFDDGQPWNTPGPRQPRQVKSNAHGDFYVDYSHGVRLIGPTAIVDGRAMLTVDLYTHPTLSRLVSNETPSAIRFPRYPADVLPPKPDMPVGTVATLGEAPRREGVGVPNAVSTTPSRADAGLEAAQRILLGRSPVG